MDELRFGYSSKFCILFFHGSLQNADGGRVHITWERVEELEEYIKKLQSAADKLTTENRILRKHHSTICDKVIVTLTAPGFFGRSFSLEYDPAASLNEVRHQEGLSIYMYRLRIIRTKSLGS